MRAVRFSIAGLMVAVAVSAVVVAALRSASEASAGAMLMLVCGVLGLAIVGTLKNIEAETEARVGRSIPIYVDPYGLQAANQTMSSKVRIDVEGAAVKNCLSRCLKQLDLTFAVRDGFLMITESGTVLPVYEDPFLIVGHCLLALIAAGVGGVLAPLVSDARGRTSGSLVNPSGPA